jgi:endo-1,4-beta-D-glucanase Y
MTFRNPPVPVAGWSMTAPAARPTLRGRISALPISAEGAWVALILLVAGLVHGINMFRFPYYESDEGTYMAQAWAVAENGALSHYTYWYDHAPIGWMQIALWAKLTGGFHTFGSTVDSGRALMLLLQLSSTLLLYKIARGLMRSVTVASIASLLFALSAYGLHYHRRVLLDNFAAFWLLAAIAPLAGERVTLRRVWFSAFAMAMSVLSKEVTVVLIPVLVYMVVVRTHSSHRWFATAGWIALTGSMISGYILLAVLKHELLPAPVLPDGSKAHVSLIETLQFQAARGKDSGIRDLDSRFWTIARDWARDEPALTVPGTVAGALLLLLGWRFRMGVVLGGSTVLFWLFLGRGGEVLDFYLVPLLPILALNVAIVVGFLADGAQRIAARRHRYAGRAARILQVGAVAASVVVSFGGYTSPHLGLADDSMVPWTANPTSAQREGVDWIQRNVAPDAKLVIDGSIWTDLQAPASGETPMTNAHWFWKVAQDPAIGGEVFHDRWQNIEYLVVTPQMIRDSQAMGFAIINDAIINSTPIERFDTGSWAIEIRWVHALPSQEAGDEPMLAKTWASYKQRFITADGRVMDPKSGGATTSEGQAYALLQAVYMDDKAAFDVIWGWTRDSLQTRGDGLLSWKWGSKEDGTTGILDATTAADADTDAALALLFAGKRWGDPAYLEAGRTMVNGIWDVETAEVAGQRIVVAGDWARGDGTANVTQPIINPSYLAPYAYRIFAEADPAHRWGDVVDGTYDALDKIQASPDFGGPAGLIPNWVALDKVTGEPISAQPHVERANEFSWDASRVPQRMALDWIWFKDDRARQVIDRLSFPRTRLEQDGHMWAAYHLDGEIREGYEATSMYAGVVPGLLVGGHRDLALRVYADKVLNSYVDDGVTPAHWGGDPDDYFNHNIAWFTCALFNGSMSNLWAGETMIQWDEVVFD